MEVLLVNFRCYIKVHIGYLKPNKQFYLKLEGVSKCKYHFDNLTVWNNSIKKTISVLVCE